MTPRPLTQEQTRFLELFDKLDAETQFLFALQLRSIVTAKTKTWRTRRMNELGAWCTSRAAKVA